MATALEVAADTIRTLREENAGLEERLTECRTERAKLWKDVRELREWNDAVNAITPTHALTVEQMRIHVIYWYQQFLSERATFNQVLRMIERGEHLGVESVREVLARRSADTLQRVTPYEKEEHRNV